nr:type VI immunity family protein [Pseudenhygromyxa sp. WMMC2535]
MLGVREPDEGETNYVEMRFPAEWADDNGERVARFALGVARILPHDSGYVSPALNWSNDAEIDDSAEDVHRLVFRHLGFDVHDHSQTYLYMGKRCLGARWMVFLGPALAEEVGGLETLSRALEGISVTATANGVALRCSGPPVPGDVNRDDDFSQLRAMAKVLEPITYFDDEIGFFDDDEEYMRWQRRFLD